MKAFGVAAISGLLVFALELSNSYLAQAGENFSQVSTLTCSSDFTLEPGESAKYLQARAASNDGKVVLHYGESLKDVDLLARTLQDDGYPVIAIAGGPKEAVRVFMNGKSSGQHEFTQSDINTGRLGGLVSSVYDDLVAEKVFSYPKCDVVRAKIKFKKITLAAEQGNATAQLELGIIYSFGKGVKKDPVKAVEWYQKSAVQGNAIAQFNLGVSYNIGNGVKKDLVESVKWHQKAANQGHATAQLYLGQSYDFGDGIKKDSVKAVEWYRKAAEQGHIRAQFHLGVSYKHGKGVTKDPSKAVKWIRTAAEQGYSQAQFLLGEMFEGGEEIEKNNTKATKWYRKASVQGHDRAKKRLGVIEELSRLEKGLRDIDDKLHRSKNKIGRLENEIAKGTKSINEVVTALTGKAKKGDSSAQFFLGVLHEKGRDVNKDLTKAVEWYRKSADQGFAKGQFGLARMYLLGWGVMKDLRIARKWARKAADQGHIAAQDLLGGLANLEEKKRKLDSLLR